MSYNDGQVHTDFYEQIENAEKIANEFSEGDELLKQGLLELWGNGIKTTACCKGHDEKMQPSYISIIIDENSRPLIQTTCEYLYLQEGKMEIDFINSENGDILSVYMCTEQDKINFFNFLHLNMNKNEKSEKVSNNILLYANYLLDFAKRSGLVCRYCVEKNLMMIGYTRPGTIQIFQNDAPQMDELINTIIETGNLPLTPIMCDEKSLEQFINLIYPNSFANKNNVVR